MSSVFDADEAALMGSDLHFEDDHLLFHSYTDLAAADVVVREPAYDFEYSFDRLITKREGGGIEDIILRPPGEMQQEEGFILRDWRRQNAMVLKEKERKEKEIQKEIIVEAEDYKLAFHEKEKLNSETNKMQNREREKLFLANQENFHANADKQYWKTIAELIPQERSSIEKKGKKELEKKPSLVVMQGPKPGKPTDLSRMREILLKLKYSPVSHVKLAPPPPPAAADKESIGNVSTSVAATPI